MLQRHTGGIQLRNVLERTTDPVLTALQIWCSCGAHCVCGVGVV